MGFFWNASDMIFPIIFGLTALGIVFVLISGIAQWRRNNRSPRLSVRAEVVAKRTHMMHMENSALHMSYYATFQVASGDRMELHVGGREYGMLAEGDFGELTFQGTRYLGFARHGVVEPTPTEETEGKTAADDGKRRSWDPEL